MRCRTVTMSVTHDDSRQVSNTRFVRKTIKPITLAVVLCILGTTTHALLPPTLSFTPQLVSPTGPFSELQISRWLSRVASDSDRLITHQALPNHIRTARALLSFSSNILYKNFIKWQNVYRHTRVSIQPTQ